MDGGSVMGRRAARVQPAGGSSGRAIGLVFGLWIVAAGAGCPKAEVVAADAGPIDPARYTAYFAHYPFGGQSLEWWRERLNEARPGGPHPDEAAVALLVERAKRNGLVVESKEGMFEVKVEPRIAEILLRRLEVK